MEIVYENENIRVIKPFYEILSNIDGKQIIKDIERVGRTCYKSENLITDDSAQRFVRGLIKSGHTAMLEHNNITVKFTCNRGFSHEMVRHRHCGFAQESSRYCNYTKDKFSNKITVIMPSEISFGSPEDEIWTEAMENASKSYFDLINRGVKTDMARGVLPIDLKTELNVSASIREWRAIFGLRCETDAHPSMRQLMKPLLKELNDRIPVVFEDLNQKFNGE